MNWRNYFCELLGCRADCSQVETELADCVDCFKDCMGNLTDAQERIRQLEALVPREPPGIDMIALKDTAFIQQAIDNMGLGVIRLGLDQSYYMTNQANFLNIVAWDWIDKAEYIKEKYDCENFAFSFKAIVDYYFKLNQVALVIDYKAGHAYNLVVYPDGNVMILEPQTDVMWAWNVRPNVYTLEGAIVLI